MSFATLAGQLVVTGSVTIGTYGPWSGDVQCAGALPASGAVSLVIGNITLAGYVYRSQPFAGQTSARLVGGFGGWRTVVPAKQYAYAGGVKLSMVLKDVAAEVQEVVNVASDFVIGSGFVRENAKASKVLRQCLDIGLIPNWYVDTFGTTQLTAWPPTTVGSPFTVIKQAPDKGAVEIATEDYASWMPGCQFTYPTVSGTVTNGGVTLTFDGEGKARLEVLTSP